MKRVCNGCLEAKPIVDDELGYCQYCVENRKVKTVKEILEAKFGSKPNVHWIKPEEVDISYEEE